MKAFPKFRPIRWLAVWLALAASALEVSAETRFEAGSAAGAPGFAAVVPMTLRTDTNVVGIQWDIVFNQNRLVTCEVSAGEAAATLQVLARPVAAGVMRVLIQSTNDTLLSTGVLALCQFTLSEDAPAVAETVGITNLVVALQGGRRLADLSSASGTVAIYGGMWLHDVEDLKWFLGGDPTAARVSLGAVGAGTELPIFSGPLAGATPVWDTGSASDGRYQLKAVFQSAAGSVTKEFVREVVVNNHVSWHSGTLTNSQTWSSNIVHVVESTVMLSAGVVLTLEPGVMVKFVRGASIQVPAGATLRALGANGMPVILTSLLDDVGGDDNYDGTQSTPKPGDWPGVQSAAGGIVLVNENAQFRFVVTLHQGDLVQDEVWHGTHLHRIVGDLTVGPGATLTIQPGAVIKFDLGFHINVLSGAALQATGTVTQPIVFTSIRHDAISGDSNLDGDRTQPAAGDWGWIFFNGGQGGFDHCQLSYGGGPGEGGWGPSGDTLRAKGMLKTTGSGASLRVSNSLLLDAFYDGVLAWGGEVWILNSVLAGIDRAVCAHPGSPVHVVNCTLYDNRIGLLAHGGTLSALNCVVADSFESGVQYDFGSLALVQHCDVWNPPGAFARTYRNTTDLTGRNGNISADPRLKDAARLNFRLDFSSPCVDAADGASAPLVDIMGAPRADDPRTPNTGVPAANGAFPDMGAYEFAGTAPSEVDLIVGEVKGPSTAVAGQVVRVEWTVVNTGSGLVSGPWHDAVYLVETESDRRILAGEYLVGQGIELGGGQSYLAGVDVRVPGGVTQAYRWLVEVNSRGEIFEGLNRTNNQSASVGTVALDVPVLTIGGPALKGTFDGSGQPLWFRFSPATNQDVMTSLDLANDNGVIELYVGRDYLPSLQQYDFKQREWNAADVAVLTADAVPDDYYVLAYPRSLSAAPAGFTIRVGAVDFMVERAKPSVVGNGGSATLEVLGANLRPGTVLSLESVNGSRAVALRTTYVDSGKVYATFSLTNLPAGKAHVVAEREGLKAIGSNLVEVVAGGSGNFYAHLTAPSALRLGRTGTWYVTYGNKGTLDVPLPLLRLTVPGAQDIKLFNSTLNWADQFVLLALHDGSRLPTLGPGQEVTVRFDATPATSGTLTTRLEVVPGESAMNSPTALDWRQLPPPPDADPLAWQAELDRLNTRIGRTLGDYYELLMRDLNDLATDYLAYGYLANVDGTWLFGPEPTGDLKPVDPVDIDTGDKDTEEEEGVKAASISAAGRKGDGIRKTYFVLVMNEDYTKRGISNLYADKTRTDVRQYLKNELKVPDDQILDMFDSTGSTNDTLTGKGVGNGIRSLTNKVDADDNLVIWYNGHGGKTNEVGYWALNGGFITGKGLTKAVEAVGPGTTYLVNDSCYAEAVDSRVKPTNSTVVSASACSSNRISWASSASGGLLSSQLKENLRNCNTLQKSFDDAQTSIKEKFGGKAKDKQRQDPVLRNEGKVDLNGKPWNDPTGFKDRVKKALKAGLTWLFGEAAATAIVGSIDPNDKTGPGGSGAMNYVASGQVLPYTVFFENKASAQAPAQEVLVVDRLDANLDWSTFQLGIIAFNDVKVTIPPGLQQYTDEVYVGSDPYPVSIQITLDIGTGKVTWLMQSIDPVTGWLPEDPFAGFLPPNDAAHHGEGYVSYTIRPKANLASGTLLQNQATIYFDPSYGLNQPIDTPMVANRLDVKPPTSAVAPLAAEVPARFEVRWSGVDDDGGSGVAAYDIYVSKDQRPYAAWLIGSAVAVEVFTGEPGATYRFLSVARDQAGNVESAPLQPDAWTVVAATAPHLTAVYQPGRIVLTIENLITDRGYVIESTPALPGSEWSTVLEFKAAAGTATRTVDVVEGQAAMFIRLRSSD